MFFDEAYAPSRYPLEILVVGQLVWSACSIAMRLIPMSGYALLDLINADRCWSRQYRTKLSSYS